jgi:hypothetical protein
MPGFFFSMPGHVLTELEIAISEDLPGKSWSNFPVEAMAVCMAVGITEPKWLLFAPTGYAK